MLGQAATRPRRVAAALFVAAVAISAFSILRGIDPFDEGLARTVAWYRENEAWWKSPVRTAAPVSSS